MAYRFGVSIDCAAVPQFGIVSLRIKREACDHAQLVLQIWMNLKGNYGLIVMNQEVVCRVDPIKMMSMTHWCYKNRGCLGHALILGGRGG